MKLRDLAQTVASAANAENAVEATRLRALTLDKLGDMALLSAKIDDARANFQQALDLRESMPEAYRNSPDGRRSRAISQNKLGDAALHAGRLDAAHAAFERGLALTEDDHDPDAQRHRFDLRFAHSRLGDVALAQFNLDAAESEYRRALHYADLQLTANPNDVQAGARSRSAITSSAASHSAAQTPGGTRRLPQIPGRLGSPCRGQSQ